MRRGVLLGAAVGIVNTGVVLLLARVLHRSTDVGWYAYQPMPRRYADYLPSSSTVSGWPAVGIVALALVILNATLVTAYLLLARRHATRSASPG